MARRPPAAQRRHRSARLFAALLSLALAQIVLGCAPAKEPSSGIPADTTTSAPASVADSSLLHVEEPVSPELLAGAAKPWTGDFDGMVKRRVIRALVVYNQTHYFFDGLRPRGISYDALVQFEQELNKTLRSRHLKVHVIHIPVTRDRLLPMLVSGQGDLAVGNLTITPERAKQVAFSMPVATGVSEVVVTHASGPVLASLEDLAGREVWVRTSSTYNESLVALNQRFRREGRDTVRIRRADERLETEDLLEMTSTGLIDITIADDHLANFWAGVFDSLRVHPELKVRTGAELGWAFRKNSPGFEKQVNAFVRKHAVGQYLGNVLFKQYLRTNKWARNPTTGSERQRFKNTAAIFKRYAAQYDFDWLMIAAQAYQESKIDQKLVSPAGAVGVMQVLPSTAADRRVNIRNIKKTENNIHAGIKYMRFIRDTYLADAPMSEVDRHLFAFASYNAGPNRVAAMRRRAAAEGLDPNVWFQNVEVVAAKEIGRETVQYVSNIFKYYVAYKLALEKGLQPKPA
jgi:membrane-bound lytic murein transglycosylase MltF